MQRRIAFRVRCVQNRRAQPRDSFGDYLLVEGGGDMERGVVLDRGLVEERRIDGDEREEFGELLIFGNPWRMSLQLRSGDGAL